MTQAPVQSMSEVKERLMQQAEQPWAFGVERIGLFGSFARDEAGLQSDVDLFVDIATELGQGLRPCGQQQRCR